MNDIAYHKMTAMASEPDALDKAADYLASHMRQFLKKRDKVLILFPNAPATVGSLIREAVLRCEAIPQFLENDHRWLTILKTAFITRCDCIIGYPLTLLGLAKVAKHMGTPLFARNVLIGGYPSQPWMVEGIAQGLDCKVWGCYDPGLSAMIAGFNCPCGHIHLRNDRYHVRIQGGQGNDLPEGTIGKVVLSPTCDLELMFDTGDTGRIDSSPCICGNPSPRLMDLSTSNGIHPDLSELWESCHYWGSILDCKMTNTGYGLELELVVFPGEKLPRFPSCAKLLVRAWNPESDEPFPHAYILKRRLFSRKTH